MPIAENAFSDKKLSCYLPCEAQEWTSLTQLADSS